MEAAEDEGATPGTESAPTPTSRGETTPKTKRNYVKLPPGRKLELLKMLDAGVSKEVLMKEFSVSRTTLYLYKMNIDKMKQKLMGSVPGGSGGPRRKRKRRTRLGWKMMLAQSDDDDDLMVNPKVEPEQVEEETKPETPAIDEPLPPPQPPPPPSNPTLSQSLEPEPFQPLLPPPLAPAPVTNHSRRGKRKRKSINMPRKHSNKNRWFRLCQPITGVPQLSTITAAPRLAPLLPKPPALTASLDQKDKFKTESRTRASTSAAQESPAIPSKPKPPGQPVHPEPKTAGGKGGNTWTTGPIPSRRRRDPAWQYFDKLRTKSGKGCRARCKQCQMELQGIVVRLKAHLEKYHHTQLEDTQDQEAPDDSEAASTVLGSVSSNCHVVLENISPAPVKRSISDSTCAADSAQNQLHVQHNFHSQKILEVLTCDETFIDVTLTAEGRSVRAHKLILSAMSPYFQEVLQTNPCQHPVIIMPRTVRFSHLTQIIDFIYRGEITLPEEELKSLLNTAEHLQISGFSTPEIMKLLGETPSGCDNTTLTPAASTSHLTATSEEMSAGRSVEVQLDIEPIRGIGRGRVGLRRGRGGRRPRGGRRGRGRGGRVARSSEDIISSCGQRLVNASQYSPPLSPSLPPLPASPESSPRPLARLSSTRAFQRVEGGQLRSPVDDPMTSTSSNVLSMDVDIDIVKEEVLSESEDNVSEAGENMVFIVEGESLLHQGSHHPTLTCGTLQATPTQLQPPPLFTTATQPLLPRTAVFSGVVSGGAGPGVSITLPRTLPATTLAPTIPLFGGRFQIAPQPVHQASQAISLASLANVPHTASSPMPHSNGSYLVASPSETSYEAASPAAQSEVSFAVGSPAHCEAPSATSPVPHSESSYVVTSPTVQSEASYEAISPMVHSEASISDEEPSSPHGTMSPSPEAQRKNVSPPHSVTAGTLPTPIEVGNQGTVQPPSSPKASSQPPASASTISHPPTSPTLAPPSPMATSQAPPSPTATSKLPNSPTSTSQASKSPASPMAITQTSSSTITKAPHSHMITSQAPHSPITTTQASHSPTPTTQASHSPTLTTQASHSPTPTTQASHSPTQASHNPTLTTQASHSPTPTTQVPHSPTPTTQVPHSPMITSQAPHSPTPTTQAPHNPMFTSQAPHSPILTTQASHSPTPTTQASHSPTPTTQASHSPMITSQAPHSPILTTQASHSPTPTTQAPHSPMITSQAPHSPIPTTQALHSPITTTQTPASPNNTSKSPTSPMSTSQPLDSPMSKSVCSPMTFSPPPSPVALPDLPPSPIHTTLPSHSSTTTSLSPHSPKTALQPPNTSTVTLQISHIPILTSQPACTSILTSQSSHSPIVTSRLSLSPVLTSQPSHSAILISQPSHSPILISQSAHSPTLKSQPSHSPVLTSQPSHSPILTSHSPILSSQSSHIPMTSTPVSSSRVEASSSVVQCVASPRQHTVCPQHTDRHITGSPPPPPLTHVAPLPLVKKACGEAASSPTTVLCHQPAAVSSLAPPSHCEPGHPSSQRQADLKAGSPPPTHHPEACGGAAGPLPLTHQSSSSSCGASSLPHTRGVSASPPHKATTESAASPSPTVSIPAASPVLPSASTTPPPSSPPEHPDELSSEVSSPAMLHDLSSSWSTNPTQYQPSCETIPLQYPETSSLQYSSDLSTFQMSQGQYSGLAYQTNDPQYQPSYETLTEQYVEPGYQASPPHYTKLGYDSNIPQYLTPACQTSPMQQYQPNFEASALQYTAPSPLDTFPTSAPYSVAGCEPGEQATVAAPTVSPTVYYDSSCPDSPHHLQYSQL